MLLSIKIPHLEVWRVYFIDPTEPESDNDQRETVNMSAATHLIDVDDFRADRFDEYFIKRAKALLGLIGSAIGKPITNLGDEDVVSAFGSSLE